MGVPQFGAPQPGRAYPDRPAAFAVVEQEGRLALVRVDLGGGRTRLDLPGGGLDPGETPERAAARECGEEAGLRVEIGELLVCADHFFINDKDQAHNTRGRFYEARLVTHDAALKIEDDHTLVWAEPLEAIRTLHREAHAWAVAAWLRRRR
jgi:8-oxo-dGTP diphosphatase